MNSPSSEQASPTTAIPLPSVHYSICSDDGQTADDEATLDRSKKLRIPSMRKSRKGSPMPPRRNHEMDKRSRSRKRKGRADAFLVGWLPAFPRSQSSKAPASSISVCPIDGDSNKPSRSKSLPRNFNPLIKRYETPVWKEATTKAKYNSLSMDIRVSRHVS